MRIYIYIYIYYTYTYISIRNLCSHTSVYPDVFMIFMYPDILFIIAKIWKQPNCPFVVTE